MQTDIESEQLPPARQPVDAPPNTKTPRLLHLLHLVIPPITPWREPFDAALPSLQAREQIMTGLLRAGALLGTAALIVGMLLSFEDTPAYEFAIDTAMLVLTWLLATVRRLGYQRRAALLLVVIYVLSLTELLDYGLSQDASIYYAFFSLLALLLFDLRIGGLASALSLATIAIVGVPISLGLFTPLTHPAATVELATVITTCMIFVMVVGSVQVGVALLFQHLEAAWHGEHQARALLQIERDQLEQRVAERTRALAQAHEDAVAARRYEAAQKDYLAALYQTTLDLLNRREIDGVLRTIVERATLVLDASHGQLLLIEDDDLVVRASTPALAHLHGERTPRDRALQFWQAYDTQRPTVRDDNVVWIRQHAPDAEIDLRAAAEFPILAEGRCIGVLAVARARPGHPFTEEDVQRGTLFSQLAALVLENVRLYDTALREIAERARVERALRQHAVELEAQNAELDAFAHTVAHDLKTPLTSIIGNSQMLLEIGDKFGPEEISQNLCAIVRVGRKMADILNALLLLARVRALETIPLAPLAMADLLDEVEGRLRETLASAGATIERPASWPVAIGYAPWVEEVWINYISNAIKYGGDPPAIALGADTTEHRQIRFWVRDNGHGLSPEQRALLFTPFTRLHTDRATGYGLGLSIVQRIIERLGGTVGVESAPGQGSRFFFTLPQREHPFQAGSDAP